MKLQCFLRNKAYCNIICLPTALAWAVVITLLGAQTGMSDDSICARVTLQVSQEAVITRTVFQATLEIDNDSPEFVENVRVELDIRDASGAPSNIRFDGLVTPELFGISDVDGGGIIAPNVTARSIWTIFPTDDAAPTPEPETYTVGGSFSYLIDGTLVNVPLYPVTIQVYPDPKLFLKYFLQSPVYSDNPFSTNVIEPAEPFSLGLLVQNSGFGDARNMHITSAQPEIVRNDNQLVIDFRILGGQVGNMPISPSLTVNFGDIPAGDSAVARWLMTSSLQGEFIAYDATFQHVNALNNPALSLIESVDIFELNHMVQLVGTGEDSLPDFLVNNRDVEGGCANAEPGTDDIPDCVHASSGEVFAVAHVLNGTFDGPVTDEDLVVELTVMASSANLNYIRVPDPGGDVYTLAQVERILPGGSSIPISTGGPGDICNAWTTHRFLPIDGPPTSQENLAHILDDVAIAGTYRYRLTYFPELSVETVMVNGALTQRSNIEKVDVSFSTAANFDELIGDGTITDVVSVWKRSTSGDTQVPLSVGRFTWNETPNRLTIDLTTDIGGPAVQSILTDGNYELRIVTESVTPTMGPGALADTDGEVDGVFHYGTVATDFFYQLRGDGNGDRLVNDADEQLIRNSWLQTAGQFDYNANADLNGNGVVNFLDIQLIRASWLNSLGF